MTKFICDTGVLNQEGGSLVSCAEAVTGHLNSYGPAIKNDTSGWTSNLGGAKGAYESTNEQLVSFSAGKIAEITALGNHLQKVAKAVDELESQLASSDI